MDELYRVILAIRAVEDYVLPVPFDGGGSVRVERDEHVEGDYLATVELVAGSAEGALVAAGDTLRDLLACFAVRAASYRVVVDARRSVQLVDPEPILDGPMPPFQSVGCVVSEEGASVLDPTGEFRRRRRVLNNFASARVSIGSVEAEARWFGSRDLWSERLRRALTLVHAAECAPDAEARFVLYYFGFEVLTASSSATLLELRTPKKQARRRLRAELKRFFTEKGYSEADAGRWVGSVSNTHPESPIDVALAYVERWGESTTVDELKWLRGQRGAYVHDGAFDRSAEANDRRESFRQFVRLLLRLELEAVASITPSPARVTDVPGRICVSPRL